MRERRQETGEMRERRQEAGERGDRRDERQETGEGRECMCSKDYRVTTFLSAPHMLRICNV